MTDDKKLKLNKDKTELETDIAHKKEFKNEITKLQENIAEVINDQINVPVHIIDSDRQEKIVSFLRQQKELKDIFSIEDLNDEIAVILADAIVFSKNKDEYVNNLFEDIKTLFRDKDYEAIIYLDGLIDLPIGLKIGPLEIVKEKDLDNKINETFKPFKKNSRHGHFPRNYSCGKVNFKSFRINTIRTELYELLELPFCVLSLFMGRDLDVKNSFGIIKSSDIHQTTILTPPYKGDGGWSKYRGDIFGEYMDILSEMTQRKNSKLEKKILQAIQIFGLSKLSQKTEIRYLMIISSLESLLLTKNDRDYLGTKLAEKTAFLMEENPQKRLDLYKYVKKAYAKRSSLIHGSIVKITKNEESEVENLFIDLIYKLLILSREYEKMEQKSHENDKEGIEDYINKLRFN